MYQDWSYLQVLPGMRILPQRDKLDVISSRKHWRAQRDAAYGRVGHADLRYEAAQMGFNPCLTIPQPLSSTERTSFGSKQPLRGASPAIDGSKLA